MLLSERSQELTAALDQRRRADNELLPHQGAIFFIGCTEVVRHTLPRHRYRRCWYNRLWELHTEASRHLLRSR